jgi:hypothetical protein
MRATLLTSLLSQFLKHVYCGIVFIVITIVINYNY